MSDFSDLVGFEKRFPSHANAVNLFSGTWVSKFPEMSGLEGGTATHFNDSRVTWAAGVLGGLAGMSVLELGPFEAYNTYQFQAAGADTIISIESSVINFLKRLVVKNIFGLNACFLHGDFQTFLSETERKFDICWASGVLYHMIAPVELLYGIRRISNKNFIWTQYYDRELLELSGNMGHFDETKDKKVLHFGREITLHYREYLEKVGVVFSGGEASYSYWMEKDDIMFILEQLGFGRISVGVDNPNHPPGPAMFFLAQV